MQHCHCGLDPQSSVCVALAPQHERKAMFFATDLSTVSHGIQLAVAPVFVLTAVSAMIGTVAGRLGRIIDRARVVEERIDAAPATDPMLV